MRPVDKGESPTEGEFRHYRQAFPELVKRLGAYCSYCERKVSTSLAVEHVCPKSKHKNLKNKWSNFLLACTQCNSSKNATDISPDDLEEYVWPDRDDTYHMITYLPENGYEARVNENISPIDKERVRKTLDLVNINANTTEYGDTNYLNKLGERRDAAKACQEQLISLKRLSNLLEKYPDDVACKEEYENRKKEIIESAKIYGFWSIWMNYFEDIPEIKARLLDFYNTKKQYFPVN